MAAMRVLIGWVYVKSVTIAQLMHASSTGSLVVFSPPRVNAAQEALWYGVYAMALWITVSVHCEILREATNEEKYLNHPIADTCGAH
jgi:hypothetical protein